MLTDPRVVKFYHSYREMDDVDLIRVKAQKDFWEHFEESRTDHNLEVWAAHTADETNQFIGWCGLLHTELSEEHGYPELQYMIAGAAHGYGYATELASAVLQFAEKRSVLRSIIAIVDSPNIGSIRVLEKLSFKQVGQIEAYGSKDMYLYRRSLD